MGLVSAGCAFAGCADDEAVHAAEARGANGNDPVGFPQLSASHPATCKGLASRLKACGLLTEGPFGCSEPEDAGDRCSFECLTAASCPILFAFSCNEQATPALERCLATCYGFRCESGESIPEDWACDSVPDCLDGSDELDCTPFECDSGESVPGSYRCDFEADCEDGSDEEACDGFRCESGELVPPAWQCDLEEDCEDASDERDCNFFECSTTGERLPPTWRCDQEHDCLDGSDEFDCAQLVCR